VRLLCSKKVQPLGVRFLARLIAGNISRHRSSHAQEEIAKLMDGVYKSGVLEAEAKPGQ
jgi:hypothetical protein